MCRCEGKVAPAPACRARVHGTCAAMSTAYGTINWNWLDAALVPHRFLAFTRT